MRFSAEGGKRRIFQWHKSISDTSTFSPLDWAGTPALWRSASIALLVLFAQAYLPLRNGRYEEAAGRFVDMAR